MPTARARPSERSTACGHARAAVIVPAGSQRAAAADEDAVGFAVGAAVDVGFAVGARVGVAVGVVGAAGVVVAVGVGAVVAAGVAVGVAVGVAGTGDTGEAGIVADGVDAGGADADGVGVTAAP